MSRVLCAVTIRLPCLSALLRAGTRCDRMSYICLVLVLFATVCLNTRTANALEGDKGFGESGWCVVGALSGSPLACVYDNLLSCIVAAIRTGGACKSRSSPAVAAIEAEAAAPPAAATAAKPRPRHTAAPKKRKTAESRDKLFRDFIQWDQQHSSQ